MKMKNIIYVCLFGIAITSCSKKSILVVEQSKQKPYGMYLRGFGKTETISLLEENNPTPDDLKFLDKNRICYLGNKMIELERVSKESIIRKRQVSNQFSEQFFSMALMNKGVVIIDSVDFSYYTDEQVAKDEYVLLGYDSLLQNKLFSITVRKNDFTVNWYSTNPIDKSVRYIYYPEYSPKSVSASEWIIRLKVLDIQESKTQLIDTIYTMYPDTVFHYFNPRYIRDENNGKLSYLKLSQNPNNLSKMDVSVYTWDYTKQEKQKVIDLEMTKVFDSDNFKHRLVGNKLYFGYDSGIMRVSKRGKKKSIYSTNQFKVLDFYVF